MGIKLLLSQGLPHGTLFHVTFVTLQILTVSKRSWKRISSHLSNLSCFVSLVVVILLFLCCAAIMFLELAHYKFWLLCYVMLLMNKIGKSTLQVPDTGTQVLDNTRPFLRSSIVSFWIPPAHSKERKYHIFRQYWHTKNVPVFTSTGMFQYLGPDVYFFPKLITS